MDNKVSFQRGHWVGVVWWWWGSVVEMDDNKVVARGRGKGEEDTDATIESR
jgi:hypothetical protein